MRVTTDNTTGVMEVNFMFDGVARNTAIKRVDSKVRTLEKSDIVHNPVLSGWRPPSGYSVTDDTQLAAVGSYGSVSKYDYGYGETYSRNSGVLDFPMPYERFVPESSDDPYRRLVTKCLLKVADSKINIAQSIAERQQTISLIGSRVTSLYRSYSSFRRGKFRDAAKHLGIRPPKTPKGVGKGSANHWLEFQYGWMPLLSDIHGAYDELTKRPRDQGYKFKVTGRDSSPAYHRTSKRGSFGDFEVTERHDVEYTSQLILWYEVELEMAARLASVGLTNPATIAWELTPWSFVVDWMLPVGDYIAALTADTGVNFLGGSYTSRKRSTRTWSYTPIAPYRVSGWGPPAWVYPEGGGETVRIINSMSRGTIRFSPRPSLPQLKNPLSLGHTLNAIALLRGLFK